MLLDFEKWHACKNDFILLWLNQSQIPLIVDSLSRQAPRLCSKEGNGIGADGILILVMAPGDTQPNEMIIINADGSRAQHCGNGVRCAGLSVYRQQLNINKNPLDMFSMKVSGQMVTCHFLPQPKSALLPYVKVNMGMVTLDEELSWHNAATKFLKEKLTGDFSVLLKTVHAGSLLNQHLFFMVEKNEPELFAKVGKLLQSSPLWDGINVTFAWPQEVTKKDQDQCAAILGHSLGELYQAYVWERGAGPTQACGSAATVLGTHICREGFIEQDQWVGIRMPGGLLYAKQETRDESQLCGPGEFVFGGKLDL